MGTISSPCFSSRWTHGRCEVDDTRQVWAYHFQAAGFRLQTHAPLFRMDAFARNDGAWIWLCRVTRPGHFRAKLQQYGTHCLQSFLKIKERLVTNIHILKFFIDADRVVRYLARSDRTGPTCERKIDGTVGVTRYVTRDQNIRSGGIASERRHRVWKWCFSKLFQTRNVDRGQKIEIALRYAYVIIISTCICTGFNPRIISTSICQSLKVITSFVIECN